MTAGALFLSVPAEDSQKESSHLQFQDADA